MVCKTHSRRLVGSRRVAKVGEPTARVKGAILFCSPERGDPVSGARARELLSAAESALTTKVVFLCGSVVEHCVSSAKGCGFDSQGIGFPIVGQHVPDLRIISWAVRAVFECRLRWLLSRCITINCK